MQYVIGKKNEIIGEHEMVVSEYFMWKLWKRRFYTNDLGKSPNKC